MRSRLEARAAAGPEAILAPVDLFRINPIVGLSQPQLTPQTQGGFKLSENGMVAGRHLSSSGNSAATWQAGFTQERGIPNGYFSIDGYAVNSAGDLVGGALNEIFFQEYSVVIGKGSGGWHLTLFPPNILHTVPVGINEIGLVGGSASVGPGIFGRAFYLLPGANTPVLLPNLSGHAFGAVLAIGNPSASAPTGLLGGVSFNDPNGTRPVLWTTVGTGEQLQVFAGTSASAVFGISALGIAVGYCVVPSANPATRAVTWSGAGISDIGSNYAIPGCANSISDNGIIVGNTVRSNTPSDSLAWAKSPVDPNPHSLTTLQATSRVLQTASSVNSKFQFVGVSSGGEYFAHPVGYRASGGPWASPSAWIWGLIPSIQNPAAVGNFNATPISLSLPAGSTSVAELALGFDIDLVTTTPGTVELVVATGRTLNVVRSFFGSGEVKLSSTARLLLDGSLNATSISLAGRISGRGSMQGDLQLLGTGILEAPANGALAIAGHAELLAGAVVVGINGTLPGQTHGQLKVGRLTLAGAALAVGGTHVPQAGDQFTLVSVTGSEPITGQFAGLPEGSSIANFMGSGRTARLTYRGGTSGRDVVISMFAAPEILSPVTVIFQKGQASSFQFQSSGVPAPGFALAGALPAGLDFDAATGVLSGIPGGDAAGDYPLTVTASNGVPPNAVQQFVLAINRRPTAGDDEAGTVQGVPTSLPIVRLLLNDSDPDGDSISLAEVDPQSSQGGSVTLAGGFVSYAPPPGFLGGDSLDYRVTDGRGGVGTGTIRILVSPSSAGQNLAGIVFVDGVPSIGAYGIPGRQYQLEFTDDLAGAWASLGGPRAAGSDGRVQFTDPTQPLPPNRYYRIQQN